MKTVGIITTFRQPNWGSVLQAYALQKVVDSLGYKSVVIDYIYPNDWHYHHGCPKYKISLVLKIKNLIKSVLAVLKLRKINPTKMDLLNQFIRENMLCTSKVKLRKDLAKLQIFDIYLSGSDQIWNPNSMLGDMSYMFDFAPESSPKIAYSSSFSCASIPSSLESDYAKYLSRYRAISVRESNGVELAKKYSKLKNVQLVLDPTLLISKDGWHELSKESVNMELPPRYILFYMLAYTYSPEDKMVELLNYFQIKSECPVVGLVPKPISFNGEYIHVTEKYDVGIHEFLWLFEHATMVVTSSFHGAAFSVNFGKPFIALEDGKSKADDRLSTLIQTLGLGKKLIDTNTIVDDGLSPCYDFEKEQKLLEIERRKSLLFLSKALEND